MKRFVALGVLVGGCYVGAEAHEEEDGAASSGSESSGATSADETSGDDDDAPEIGDCDPGTIAEATLRRLNRREYRNTVQDLFGLDDVPELALPWDNLNGAGFDNDGAALTLDVGAADQYYDAAEVILAETGAAPLLACAGMSGDALDTCVDDGLQAWLRLAFRRPPSDETVALAQALLAEAQSFDEVRETLVVFTLTSPHFLFHYKSAADREIVDGYEIADRLAYLVWSSAPDAELLDAAESGALADRDGLANEVERMLADARSDRFHADFPALWLRLGLLQEKPEHAELFADMRHETTAFFEHVARSEAAVGALLDSDHSVLNGRLAAHYGIDVALADDAWELVELPANERTGLLTHGSVLVASGGNDFSDPIRRGSFVAHQIACLDPPPPPFEPPPLPDPEDVGASTIREVLEQHRTDPTCAGCHALMDPYGLALENYDSLGVYRTAYESGEPIDASGELPSGIAFDDTIDLSRKLAREEDFGRCVATFLAEYAMARPLDDDETCFVELAVETAGADASVDDLLVALVTSYLFAVTGGVQ